MPKAPSAAKRFAPQCPRNRPLSTNSATIRTREYRQSRFGFEAEEQRIKTKYRTRLARAKGKMMAEDCWSTLSPTDQKRKERELITMMDQEKEKELRKAALDWSKFIKGELSIHDGGDEKAGVDSIESDVEDEEGEWEEWNGIQDNEMGVDNDGPDGSSESETEDEESDLKTEIFVDDEGNPICLKEVKGDLKEIYERHMGEIQKKLAIFEEMAKLEDTKK